MKNPAQFLREVNQERQRVVWPSRKETMTSTTMVIVLVAIASVFFLIVDYLLGKGMAFILGLGA